MLNLLVNADLEKRIITFLKRGSKIKIVMDPFASPRTAQVQIDLKDGLSPDMVEGMGSANFVLNFDSVSESIIEPEIIEESEESRPRRPALPHVESEYDEVRDVIDTDLGSPIQTLFSQKQTPLRQQSQQQFKGQPKVAAQKGQYVVPDPDLIPEKKIAPQPDQMQDMMKKMQFMMAQMQAMQSGQPIQMEENQQEKEEDIDSIMTAQEFFETLSNTGNDLPDIDFSKKLSKDEIVELEKYKINKPAYVLSAKGVLFVDDVGISIRPSLACNLSSIPIFKLKKSSDLVRCLKNGMLKFVDYRTAKRLAEKADLTSATEGVDNKLKTFFGADGSGVDTAMSAPTDITPGVSDDSSSERMMRMASRGRARDGIIVDDFEESDIVNESDTDEQSDLINLTGSDFRQEEASEARLASVRDKNRVVSKTWKPTTRLDE